MYYVINKKVGVKMVDSMVVRDIFFSKETFLTFEEMVHFLAKKCRKEYTFRGEVYKGYYAPIEKIVNLPKKEAKSIIASDDFRKDTSSARTDETYCVRKDGNAITILDSDMVREKVFSYLYRKKKSNTTSYYTRKNDYTFRTSPVPYTTKSKGGSGWHIPANSKYMDGFVGEKWEGTNKSWKDYKVKSQYTRHKNPHKSTAFIPSEDEYSAFDVDEMLYEDFASNF